MSSHSELWNRVQNAHSEDTLLMELLVMYHRFYELDGVKCNHREIAPRRFEFVIPDEKIEKENRKPMTRLLRSIEMPPEIPSPGPSLANSSTMKVPTTKHILKCKFMQFM